MEKYTQLKLDLTLAESLRSSPISSKEMSKLRLTRLDPEQTRDSVINKIIAKYQQMLTSQTAHLRDDLQAYETKMTRSRTAANNTAAQYQALAASMKTIEDQIQPLYEQFESYFPRFLVKNGDIADKFNDLPLLLNKLKQQTGFIKRMFSFSKMKQEITELHQRITKLMVQAGITSPTQTIPHYDLESLSRKHDSHEREYKENESKYNEILKKIKEIYDTIYNEMHKEIGCWLSIADMPMSDLANTVQIPHILYHADMQYLHTFDEPVAFFQTFSLTDPHSATPKHPTDVYLELKKILEQLGLKIGYNPGDYILRRSTCRGNHQCIELITPFYSPERAHANISTLLKYITLHDTIFQGVIHPATASQIHPKPTQPISHPDTEISKMIAKKLKQQGHNSSDIITQKYPDGGSFVYRGHTFATADPQSSYATPTWRPGRTGLAYATKTASYALGYAGFNKPGLAAGDTMNPADLPTIQLNGETVYVGFLSVFSGAHRLNYQGDGFFEEANFYDAYNYPLKNVPETVVSKAKNPLVARYMVLRGYKTECVLEIDENDPTWHNILNFFAPDMKKTFSTDLTHGQQLTNLLEQYGTPPKTYDLTDEQLKQMGYQAPTTTQSSISAGTAKLQTKISKKQPTPPPPVHPTDRGI